MPSHNVYTKSLIILSIFTTLWGWASWVSAEENPSKSVKSSIYHVPKQPEQSPEVKEIIDRYFKFDGGDDETKIDDFLYREIIKKAQRDMSRKNTEELANELDQLTDIAGPMFGTIIGGSWFDQGGSSQIDDIHSAIADILKVYSEAIVEQIKEKKRNQKSEKKKKPKE